MRTSTLTDRIAVSRNGAIPGSHKTGSTTVATGIACLITAAAQSAAAQRGLDLSQAYDLYTQRSANIKVGDKVTDQTGRVFFISGIQLQPGIYTDHMHCLANLEV